MEGMKMKKELSTVIVTNQMALNKLTIDIMDVIFGKVEKFTPAYIVSAKDIESILNSEKEV